MFRAYFEGLNDPTSRALPSPTTTEDMSIGARLGKPSRKTLTREWDPLFKKHAGILPVPFLRALARSESNFNPNETKGTHWGILQVGWRGKHAVLKGFNERNGTSFTKQDLLKPDLNIQIASSLVNRIAKAYRGLAKENPAMMINMVPNFSNPEFVKLLLAGWNSGYSRAGGVQRVARFLAKKGIPVTHDAVFANAARAGATKWLRASIPGEAGSHARRKQRWQRGVAARFFRQSDANIPTPPPTDGGGDPLIVRKDDVAKPGTSAKSSLVIPAAAALALGTVALLAMK